MKDLVRDYRTFFREARGSFRTVGAVAPSGRFLARAIAWPLRDGNGPRRVLEVGPGTGALTWEIVRYLGPHDRLDIVELNAQFVDALNDRFRREWHFRRVADRTQILHRPVQEHAPEAPYDCIISGLPFNSFPTELVQQIFENFERLAAPGGVLSFFEYMWVRDVRRLFVPRRERRRLLRVGSLIERYLDRYEFRRDTVLVNLPPALVHHLRMAP
jgi:phospholipid N-methyltransferase